MAAAVETQRRATSPRRQDILGASHPETVAQLLAAHQLELPTAITDPRWPEARRSAALEALPLPTPTAPDGAPLLHIGFTSGSSGAPKAYGRDEASWLASFALDRRLLGLSARDIVAAPGALSHSLPLYGVLSALHAGAQAIVTGRYSLRDFVGTMRAQNATVLTTTPSQIQLITRIAEADGLDMPDLRLVLSGGAALSDATRFKAAQVFPNARIVPYYGASELSYVSIACEETPAGSVGRPAAGVRVAIVDQTGERVPRGEIGRISVETPFAAAGYLTQSGLTPLPRLGGGMCLGDVGRLDVDGFLYVEGRADRVIIAAGRNLAPERIEAVLEAHPAVRAAAVLGVEDALRGARLIAIVELERPAPAAELRDACRTRLGGAETPSRFFRSFDWPRLSSGKTDIAALRRMLAGGRLERLP